MKVFPLFHLRDDMYSYLFNASQCFQDVCFMHGGKNPTDYTDCWLCWNVLVITGLIAPRTTTTITTTTTTTITTTTTTATTTTTTTTTTTITITAATTTTTTITTTSATETCKKSPET